MGAKSPGTRKEKAKRSSGDGDEPTQATGRQNLQTGFGQRTGSLQMHLWMGGQAPTKRGDREGRPSDDESIPGLEKHMPLLQRVAEGGTIMARSIVLQRTLMLAWKAKQEGWLRWSNDSVTGVVRNLLKQTGWQEVEPWHWILPGLERSTWRKCEGVEIDIPPPSERRHKKEHA